MTITPAQLGYLLEGIECDCRSSHGGLRRRADRLGQPPVDVVDVVGSDLHAASKKQ